MWDATGKKNNTNMAHAVGNHSRQRQSRCRYLARVGCSCRNERLAIQLAASYSILNFQVFLRTTTRLATVTTNPVTKTKNPNLGSTRTAIATAKTVPNANRALSNAKSKILFKTRMSVKGYQKQFGYAQDRRDHSERHRKPMECAQPGSNHLMIEQVNHYLPSAALVRARHFPYSNNVVAASAVALWCNG